MSRASRSQAKPAPTALPVPQPRPDSHSPGVAGAGQHAIDMPPRSAGRRSQGSSSRSGSGSSGSTAGDPFYDSFAQLELCLMQASNQLMHMLHTIKTIRQTRGRSQQARQLRKHLSGHLESSGALLDELHLLQTRFDSLSSSSSRTRSLSAAEQSQRREVRDKITADIEQLRRTYAQVRGAAMAFVEEEDAGGAEEAAHENTSLLAHQHTGAGSGLDGLSGVTSTSSASSAASTSSFSSSLPSSYQTQEVQSFGSGLEGHLSMLEASARSRAEFMAQLSKDVVQVHELFQDVRYMVDAQQPMIEVIEDNIEMSRGKAMEGEAQIKQAQAYQASKRRRMCCLLFLIFMALFLLLLFMWVAAADN